MAKAITPEELDAALADVRSGAARLFLTNNYNAATEIKTKTIIAWDNAGKPLFRVDGKGFRMRQGKGSVYLFPGQLVIA